MYTIFDTSYTASTLRMHGPGRKSKKKIIEPLIVSLSNCDFHSIFYRAKAKPDSASFALSGLFEKVCLTKTLLEKCHIRFASSKVTSWLCSSKVCVRFGV